MTEKKRIIKHWIVKVINTDCDGEFYLTRNSMSSISYTHRVFNYLSIDPNDARIYSRRCDASNSINHLREKYSEMKNIAFVVKERHITEFEEYNINSTSQIDDLLRVNKELIDRIRELRRENYQLHATIAKRF